MNRDNVNDRPRVSVFSLRHVNHHVARSSVYEFEDLICAVEQAELITPRSHATHLTRPAQWLNRALRRCLHAELTPMPRMEFPASPPRCDLLVALCGSIADLRTLRNWPHWRNSCRRAVCWIDELWIQKLDEFPSDLRLLEEFDEIFVGFERTGPELARRRQRPCHVVPQGVDALRFAPRRKDGMRTVDVLSIGRRPADTHALLRNLAVRDGLEYVYDTAWLADVDQYVDHRTQLARRIQQARCFLVAPARITDANQTQGQSELATRYFEGAAAGSVLLGSRPRDVTWERWFPWSDAIIDWQPDADGTRRIHEILADTDRLRSIQCSNVVQSLLRHDWIYRWQMILRTLQISDSAASVERQARLQELAQAWQVDGQALAATVATAR